MHTILSLLVFQNLGKDTIILAIPNRESRFEIVAEPNKMKFKLENPVENSFECKGNPIYSLVNDTNDGKSGGGAWYETLPEYMRPGERIRNTRRSRKNTFDAHFQYPPLVIFTSKPSGADTDGTVPRPDSIDNITYTITQPAKKKEVKKKAPAPSATATDAPAPAVAKADLTFVHDIKFNLRYRFTGFLHHFLKLQYAAVALQISSIDAPKNSTAVLLDQKTAMRSLTLQIPQKDRITTCHATRLLLKAPDFEITAAIPGDQWTNYKFTLDKAKQKKTLTITTLLNTYFGIGKDDLGGFLDLVGIAALQKFEVEVGRVKKPPFANTGK